MLNIKANLQLCAVAKGGGCRDKRGEGVDKTREPRPRTEEGDWGFVALGDTGGACMYALLDTTNEQTALRCKRQDRWYLCYTRCFAS